MYRYIVKPSNILIAFKDNKKPLKNNTPVGQGSYFSDAVEVLQEGVNPYLFDPQPQFNPSFNNLKKGNIIEEYKVSQRAVNKLNCWLLFNNRYKKCVHFVITVPREVYNSNNLVVGDDEVFIQSKFRYLLDTLRRQRIIKDYCWFKERQKNGSLHYHFIHAGRVDFKYCNRLWVRSLGVPHVKNAVTHKRGHAKLRDTEICKYFVSYFNKGDTFKRKAYFIGSLPSFCEKGSVEITTEQLYSIEDKKTKLVVDDEFFKIYQIKPGTFIDVFRHYEALHNAIVEMLITPYEFQELLI